MNTNWILATYLLNTFWMQLNKAGYLQTPVTWLDIKIYKSIENTKININIK